MMHRQGQPPHRQASREPARPGGNGPDYDALREGLEQRAALTLDSRVHFPEGYHGRNPPYCVPGNSVD